MTNSLALTLALAGLSALSPLTRAALIEGTVDFTGTAAINGTGPLDATAFTSFTSTAVDVGTGSYSGTVGTAATIQPLSFAPPSAPIPDFWSFTTGGKTYSFDLATLVKDSQGPPADGPGLGVIRVSGTGTAHLTGFSDTPASFVLHASGGVADLELAFGSSTAASGPQGVPDTGSTWMLLSAGLGGLAALRRKLT